MRIYIDTNVYLDLFFNRSLSIYAEQILNRAILCEFYVVISDIVVYELEKYISTKQIELLKDQLGIKAILVLRSCSKANGLHYPDNVHLQTAIDANCDVFITNDHAFFDISSSIRILSSQIF
jgi:predicted nucleic acid-binding protein